MEALKRFKRSSAAWAVLLVLAFVGISAGDIAQVGYQNLRGTAPAAVQTTVSSIDTTIWTGTPLHVSRTFGNPSVTAYVTFSTASATCSLACGLYFQNSDGTYTYLGQSKAVTVTASSTSPLTTDAAGRYIGVAAPTFDTLGCPYYDLRVVAISAGNVTVVPWEYGSYSQPHD